MSGRGWTVAMDEDNARQLTILPRRFRSGSLILAGILLVVLPAVGVLVYYSGLGIRIARLQADNEAMRKELASLEAGFTNVEDRMSDLAERDSQLRVFAGLDPIDPDILLAGVGGPGSRVFDPEKIGERDPGPAERAFGLALDLEAIARRADILSASLDEAAENIEARVDLQLSTPSIKPARGYISSVFSNSRWHPLHKVRRPHQGVDIVAPVGTPIVATAKGRVVRAGRFLNYGNTVDIDHGYGFMTRYAHASEILVRVGQMVHRGDPIALIGRTGDATGPHVHYEVHVDEEPRNPLNYLLAERPRN